MALALAETAQDLRTLHCTGCGRRLLEYEALGGSTVIRVRCRDCKHFTELRGANWPALLTTLGVTRKGE